MNANIFNYYIKEKCDKLRDLLKNLNIKYNRINELDIYPRSNIYYFINLMSILIEFKNEEIF
jgi:hypothetical protein